MMLNLLKKYRTIFGILILIGLIELIALLLVWEMPSKLIARTGMTTSTPAPTSPDPKIQALQVELNRPQLSDFARESLQEKIKMAELQATEQAVGAGQPRNEKVAPPLAPASSEMLLAQQVPEGIFEGSEGMVSPSVAQISNVWQGTYQGYMWQVFAGSPADRSDLGILMIYIENPVEQKRSLEVVQAPGNPGKLRIMEVKDAVITLQTIDGIQLFFNMETKKFQE